VNAIRTDPGKISFALIGGTGVPDVDIAQFRAAVMAKGVDVSKTRSVTYKGTGEVLPALQADTYHFPSPPPAGPIRSSAPENCVRGRDLSWALQGLANVPTMIEAGFPSVDMVYWAGLGGPPGLPANIVKILDDAVRESLNDPDVVANLDKYGLCSVLPVRDKYRKFVLDEGEAVKALKLNKSFPGRLGCGEAPWDRMNRKGVSGIAMTLEIILLVMATAGIYEGARLSKTALLFVDPVGPGCIFSLCPACCFVCGIALLLRRFIRRKAAEREVSFSLHQGPAGRALLLLFLYAFAITYLGYLIASAIFFHIGAAHLRGAVLGPLRGDRGIHHGLLLLRFLIPRQFAVALRHLQETDRSPAWKLDCWMGL